ncbi:MAG: hypothetical protein IT581_20130 [Verrucomicrobiales bacterium]|nr:hypothetical protein [Verrucomicrobiales bacterium]
MRLVRTTAVPTMAVDSMGRCYWNPDTVAKWKRDEVAAVLVHEVSHLLRQHHARAKSLGIDLREEGQRLQWNTAADLEINDDIKTFPLPAGALRAAAFNLPDGNTAEWYFNHLPPSPGANGANGGGQEGGSCADGHARPYELDADDPNAPGLTPIQQRMLAEQVAKEIRSAGIGTVPSGLRRWADMFLAPPVVPWWRELRSSFRNAVHQAAGRVDYTWNRLPRREAADADILLPAPFKPEVPVAVVVDTSGSMGNGEGLRCLSELRGLTRALGLPVDVIACDAAAAVSKRVLQPRQARLLGGGGTDMRVAIDVAERLRPRPAVIVTMTDGETPWPERAPRAKHITLLVGEGKGPAFGKVIKVMAEE